jgi:hypothetical protein
LGKIGQLFIYIKEKLKFVTSSNEYVTQRDRREPFFTRFKKGMYYIMGYSTPEQPVERKNSILFESHVTSWLNGDPNQISYSALRNTDDIDLMTMDPFADEERGFKSVTFV